MNGDTIRVCGDCRHYEAVSETEGVCSLMMPVIPLIMIDAQDISCENYEEGKA